METANYSSWGEGGRTRSRELGGHGGGLWIMESRRAEGGWRIAVCRSPCTDSNLRLGGLADHP